MKEKLRPLIKLEKKQVSKPDQSIEEVVEKRQEEELKLGNLVAPQYLIEKVRDYVFWERTTQRQFIIDLLEDFFKNKDVKKRSTTTKVGRKRKSKRSMYPMN